MIRTSSEYSGSQCFRRNAADACHKRLRHGFSYGTGISPEEQRIDEGGMMDGPMMGGGMMIGMVIFWLLVAVALLLGIAALIKYLRRP